MHVRKFEADSVEQALQDIKKHLGPEAIILKTITNKGLKGTFKRKKIEITAAISEENYIDKSRVDNILDQEQKDLFYSDNANSISKTLNRYTSTVKKNLSSGYDGLALNKSVNTVKPKSSGQDHKTELDDFLDFGNEDSSSSDKETGDYILDNIYDHSDTTDSSVQKTMISDNSEVINQLSSRINKLEELLLDQVNSSNLKQKTALQDLRNLLTSFGINESSVKQILKKITFEFSEEELQDEQHVFDFALREILAQIPTGMPLFSKIDVDKGPVITVLMSDSSSGQTSMALKLASMNTDVVLIQSGAVVNGVSNLSEKVVQDIFSVQLEKVNGISEIVSVCRKEIDAGKSVIVDYKNVVEDVESTRKFIETLHRSFANVEALLSLSAIHSEMYNLRALEKYRVVADGVVLSHLDHCLDYGPIFNVATKMKEIPFKFYGTGKNIPNDLESATPERLMAGILKL